MVYAVYNEKYIAAITDSLKQLSEWVRECDIPEGMKVETLNYGFPLVVFECNDFPRESIPVSKYTFFPGDYPEKNPAGFGCYRSSSPKHTIFTFDKPWQGQPNWSDYMGILSHEHFGQEED